jgi:hypothetical protein
MPPLALTRAGEAWSALRVELKKVHLDQSIDCHSRESGNPVANALDDL